VTDYSELTLEPSSGLVRQARQVASPNCDSWPAQCDPELIVVHGISLPPGEFGGPEIDNLFTNCLDPTEHPYFAEIGTLRVSSHFLVRRDGELVQYVSVNQRAWHAGESSFAGRSRCNDFSIGIELEGTDDIPYTDKQYSCLAGIIGLLRKGVDSLADAAIVGHSEIAAGRKTDPGSAFDWKRLNVLLDDSRHG
jgi:AmpD protein